MSIKLNWGTGIALVYIGFAAATTGFVAFAMGRPVDLVSNDYYAQSLRQDGRMLAERNTLALTPAPSIEQVDGRTAVVSLPAGHAAGARGTITLYRASDSRADRTIAMAFDRDGRQPVDLRGLVHGQWIVQMRWTAADREYYFEQPVFAR